MASSRELHLPFFQDNFPQLGQRAEFDLADAFARDAKLERDLFQSGTLVAVESESPTQNLRRTFRQLGQQTKNGATAELLLDVVRRGFGILIGDDFAEGCAVFVAEAGVDRD